MTEKKVWFITGAGRGMGVNFAEAALATGHEVVFSYARSTQKLKRLAKDARGKALAGTPRDAAQDADALLLAVHWSRIDDVLSQTGDLSDKVIVTCSLPMNADNTVLVIGHNSSGAEALAKKGYRAKCFSASTRPGAKPICPALCTCGDNARSKEVAAELIRDVGFDPVDAGPLRIARYTEPFALHMAQLAYEGNEGPELAYRFEQFGE